MDTTTIVSAPPTHQRSVHQPATTTSPTSTKTTTPRLPNPFSIESIISPRNKTSPAKYQPHLNRSDDEEIASQIATQSHDISDASPLISPATGTSAQPPIGVGVGATFPSLYNPWMDYLAAAQQHHQQQQQLQQQPATILDNGTSAMTPSADFMFGGMPLDPARMASIAIDPLQREKLAQLFVNNVRDPKFTELLLGGANGGGIHHGADEMAGHMETMPTLPNLSQIYLHERNRLWMQHHQQQHQQHQQQQQHHQLGQPNQHHLNGQQHPHNAIANPHQRTNAKGSESSRDLDVDSAESSSELSINMSPDDCRKSAGN